MFIPELMNTSHVKLQYFSIWIERKMKRWLYGIVKIEKGDRKQEILSSKKMRIWLEEY